jgi:hypothetical protein
MLRGVPLPGHYRQPVDRLEARPFAPSDFLLVHR